MENDICNNHDIKLSSIKKDGMNSFRIHFDVKNQRYNLYNAMGFKLFNLLAELNKDTIEESYTEKYDDSTKIIINGFVFKQIGKDFGIAQKYMFSTIEQISNEDGIFRYVINQIDKPNNIQVPKGAESVIKSNSILDITINDSHHASFVYFFSLNFDEDTPAHMDNLPGLLMKKIFFRLKKFLDNII